MEQVDTRLSPKRRRLSTLVVLVALTAVSNRSAHADRAPNAEERGAIAAAVPQGASLADAGIETRRWVREVDDDYSSPRTDANTI